MAFESYRDLLVWQRGMDFVEQVYQLSKMFPREEMFALTSQLRRAAVSVPSNVAEGQGRGATADFVRFLRTTQGSLQEAETQILVAGRLGYVTDAEIDPVMATASEVGRMNRGLMASITR